jgi:4-amino-4-deoxy-L-arabinose transferase-like glycosyltransferase
VLIRAGTAIFGQTGFGVRFFPILAGTAAAAGVTFTARELGDDHAAEQASLIFACLPLAAVGLVLATPDAPMLASAAWAMYAVVRAVKAADPVDDGGLAAPDPRAALRWWLVAGLAMGCAMASKYTSVLLPAGIAVGFLAHPRLQGKFAEPGPYLAVLVASLVIAPVLWWNATHDWVSFKFQLGHGLGAPKGGALGVLNRELELIGGQVGLVSPILFFFVARAVKRAFDPRPGGLRLALALLTGCCLAFFVYSATRRSVEANWPAIAYLPAVVLLATDLPESWRADRWYRRGLGLGAALIAIIYVHVIFPIIPLPASRDQVAKAFGWELLGEKVDQKRALIVNRASFGAGDLFFAGERYQDASELAFHIPSHPRVFSLNLTGRPNQYDLWGTFPERARLGAVLLLVLDDEPSDPRVIRKLAPCFQRVDAQESVALVRRGDVVARKRIWILQGWNGDWPRRDQQFPLP